MRPQNQEEACLQFIQADGNPKAFLVSKEQGEECEETSCTDRQGTTEHHDVVGR